MILDALIDLVSSFLTSAFCVHLLYPLFGLGFLATFPYIIRSLVRS